MNTQKKQLRILIVYNETKFEKSTKNIDIISEVAVKNEANAVYKALKNFNYKVDFLPLYDIERDIKTIKDFQPDAIFNLCEGFLGNAQKEMYIAGLWELLRIPYTGNNALTLGLAQNKILTKKLLQSKRIPTPTFQVFESAPKSIMLDFPLIVKPAYEDGSVGITQESVVNNLNELRYIVEKLITKYKQPILVETFISGREFNVSILGNQLPKILAISEVIFEKVKTNFYPITSYEAKWLTDHPLFEKTPTKCPAEIPEMLRCLLEDTSLQVYKLLMGRDYGRVDIRVDNDGKIYVLEYNPNPDISLDAGFSKAVKYAGKTYEEFIHYLIQQALSRKNYD